jgi:hypothetical protein
MCLLSSAGLSKLSSATTDVSLITLPPESSSCRTTQLRMSCLYTSSQNGKAECIIRSVNNAIRTLLIQASLPGRYWAEGLHTATYLLNCFSTTVIQVACPYVLPCLVPRPPTSICASLVVRATLTRLPPRHISSPHVLPGVSF